MPVQRPPLAPRPKISHVEIYWKTVTYRTVAIYVIMIFAVVMATLYLIFPETFSGAMTKISEAIGARTTPTAELTAKQAKFVNLDGRVQVKKVNSVQWVSADYRMALDKGDLIQTGGDAAARVTFADGTTYTFNLPEQTLADTLRAIGRQTALNIVFAPETVEHVAAPPVRGEYTAEQALTRALAGTKLRVEEATHGSFLVEPLLL